MKKIFTIICLFTLTHNSHANVYWQWSFDTESGYFITDGVFSDTLSNANFQFLSFHVTQSVLPGNVGGTYVESQPTQGFIWNGTVSTQFYRSSGGSTNGSNFFLDGVDLVYGLQAPPIATFLKDPSGMISGTFAEGLITLTPTQILFLNGFE
jgi:hypothetical protein